MLFISMGMAKTCKFYIKIYLRCYLVCQKSANWTKSEFHSTRIPKVWTLWLR